jgi:lysine 2,3-aminomutase
MNTIRTPQMLADAGLIGPDRIAELTPVAARYAVAITPSMAELIEDADDPIGRQFLPSIEELTVQEHESPDPIGDDAHSPLAGVVHRYPDRVLLKLTHVCATYCRFCFRRETVGPGKGRTLSAAQVEAAIAYVASDPRIWEVIFTGSDPLVLSPRRIRSVVAQLAAIGHVKVVRFHTRAPVVDPGAVTPEMIDALTAPGLTTYVALHANHPRELSPQARAACARIVEAGIPMLSQTVLLRGVNDDADTLAELMRAFVETRIKPYYLHHLDAAPGVSHFRTSVDHGQALIRGLRGRVSGLCQPTYVLDIPGGAGKVPIGPNYITESTVEDPSGDLHPYPTFDATPSQPDPSAPT